ncbi:MAG: nucleotide sugar dehydrogenase [Cellulosilyticaceae bacterium]
MLSYDSLLAKEDRLSVIGLGYVGIVLAIAFARHFDVIGFDKNIQKINAYLDGIDPTDEVGSDALLQTSMTFTSDSSMLRHAKCHIIAVPTPVNADHSPDLTPLIKASETVGTYLTPGSIVVYESTVYPGVTEDICIPLLEEKSGLICGKDFKVGYSPERVNPGDKIHTVDKIIKIVSGIDAQSLETIAKVYECIIDAGVYRAPSIKVAEAAKVIENAQRDINIAFVNELSIIFDKMHIDTLDVLKAASTKWNFLNFYPGLVGGHCIGVDPYYLTYKADLLGYQSQVILSGRHINDSMGKYVAEKVVKLLIAQDKRVKGANVGILGITFKENCPDVRNSKVVDIIHGLTEYGIHPFICDPLADILEVEATYNLSLMPFDALPILDALIIAVSHDFYKNLTFAELSPLFAPHGSPILLDLKGILDKEQARTLGYTYWRL